MIDPVIFTIGGFPLRWYGVIVMLGVIVGSVMVERVLKKLALDVVRDGDPRPRLSQSNCRRPPNPTGTARDHGNTFIEGLHRLLRRTGPLARPAVG